MNEIGAKEENMKGISRLVGIFISPKETFESINKSPDWLVPFIIVCVLGIAMNLLIMDIAIADRMAYTRTLDLTPEQLQAMEAQAQGGWKYAGLIAIPLFLLIGYLVVAGILAFCGSVVLGGETRYKKVLSVVAWASLIPALGNVIKSLMILARGTSHGVATSLAVLLPAPAWGETPSILYRFLSRLDIFSIWQLVLWVFGLSAVYHFSIRKSTGLVLTLWGIWVAAAVALGGTLSRLGMM
ncbi:MAG TPA: YIP1 family protein [bacterium]|nr:YIP1 family protein [bacterium]